MSLRGYRKFAVCVLTVTLAFVLAMASKMTGGEFVTVAVTAIGAFAAANAYERKVNGQT